MNARRRIAHIKEILEKIGIEPERVEMFNLSAAMASEFVRITEEMKGRIEALGPNPLKQNQQDAPQAQKRSVDHDNS